MTLAVTALGRDRPGIVAGLTGVLVEAGGNVDDSQMSLLHGQFAVMLIVSVPDDTHVDRLRVQLDEAGRGLGLDAVTVC
ncbi:MAG: ACT domain-containing protein, partial [Solirubrobacterales bacterium]